MTISTLDWFLLACTVVSVIMAIISYGKKNQSESNHNSEKAGEWRGETTSTLKSLVADIKEIKETIKAYPKEIGEQIDKKIADHVRVYHNDGTRNG